MAALVKGKKMEDKVFLYALEKKTALIEKLKKLVSCPSVGADPKMSQGMESARKYIETWLDEMGFKNLRRLEASKGSGQPVIYAERLDAPKKPTIIVYAHYDVQPPDPLDKWQTPPFEVTEKKDRLYGRGISDDKGPMMIALQTISAFIKVEGKLPFNLKLIIEGEEETGSPSLPIILEKYSSLLSADAVLSADGARWRHDLVALNVGSRGNTGFQMKLTTASKDLHSGRYGGIVANALHEMAKLISSLHNHEGRIMIPGFYDSVLPITRSQKDEISLIPNSNQLFKDLEAIPLGEKDFTSLENLWYRPSLDVNGMWGGYTGEGSKTVIANEAYAKITMRLVNKQDPEETQNLVINYLKSKIPAGSKLVISDQRGSSGAYTVPENHPLLKAASNALEATTGQQPFKVRIGASLPLTEIVHRILGIDTVMFSFALSDENFHAPNEFFRKSSITDGLKAWVKIFREIQNTDINDYTPYRLK